MRRSNFQAERSATFQLYVHDWPATAGVQGEVEAAAQRAAREVIMSHASLRSAFFAIDQVEGQGIASVAIDYASATEAHGIRNEVGANYITDGRAASQ